uniref:Uncharacterized protein n=1 Tax=Cuerna arida TaxID=1464854 RepID=A0A1B6F5W2_9HEMI
MKLNNNSNKSTSNVCKEDVLMCIFKVRHSSEELLLWSSLYPSQEAVLGSAKKSHKSHKKADLHEDCRKVVKAILSSDSVKSEEETEEEKEDINDGNNFEGSGQIGGSTETMKSEDEEGFARNSSLSTATDCVSAEDSQEAVINKSQVMKLLNEAHTSILESSILLTTHKLNKKVKKTREDNLEKDTPSDSDVLFDQIQAEEETSEGTSKLCLVLGKLVTKYLKVK